jgi:hypothetical protein
VWYRRTLGQQLIFLPIVSFLSCLFVQSISGTITASNQILGRLRNQSIYRKKNSKKAPATLSKAINKVGLADSSIRVNRVGGPMGWRTNGPRRWHDHV